MKKIKSDKTDIIKTSPDKIQNNHTASGSNPDLQLSPAAEKLSIMELFQKLFAIYGEQYWWPCRSGQRWEIITGAILTQNTAWRNVEKALANLEKAHIMSPDKILSAPDGKLQELIRPAGFYHQKCSRLKGLAGFFLEHEPEFIQSDEIWDLRRKLLEQKGVGRETADSILLYAFDKPVFVIDAYTRRVAERHLGLDGNLPYDQLQQIFMAALKPDIKIYGEYHALILALCKDSCKKSGCGNTCKKIG